MNIDPETYVQEIIKRAILEESVSQKLCFMCGNDPSNGPGEHVFPRWLQKKFEIKDLSLTLLNQSKIPYRQLTVPCCEKCNTGFLSRLENQVKDRIESGETLRNKDYLMFGRWISKILIGILTKEASLPADRSQPGLGTILKPTFADNFFTAHMLLQSVRKKTTFSCLHSEFPMTLYHYRIKGDAHRGFDITTNLLGASVAVVLGNLGLVFVNDGGMQMEIGPKGPFALLGAEVSFAQFRELSARIHCKSSLRDATHFYLNSETPELLQMDQVKVVPYSENNRMFKDWDEIRLSHFIEMYVGIERDKVFIEGAQACGSIVVDEDMNLIDCPISSAAIGNLT